MACMGGHASTGGSITIALLNDFLQPHTLNK
jgi:hypothetical protein